MMPPTRNPETTVRNIVQLSNALKLIAPLARGRYPGGHCKGVEDVEAGTDINGEVEFCDCEKGPLEVAGMDDSVGTNELRD